MDRRRSLAAMAAMAAAAASPVSGRVFALEQAPARLLVVFLRGAYDAASLLVPRDDAFYRESRPSIAIPTDAADPQAAVALDADWALHPALRETVWPMFERRELAFVPFSGTHDVSRSHFETQDVIECAQDDTAARRFDSGWLNRLAGELGSARQSIAFADPLPMICRGASPIANVALRGGSERRWPDADIELILTMYRGTPLSDAVEQGLRVRQDVDAPSIGAMPGASRNAISARGFEGQARRVGRLMADRYRLGFIDIGGWDTHVAQGGASGYPAARFDELGRGLAALADELGPAWRDTVVVVLSEFGRTFRENGNRGTDHGHGSIWWLLGGAVRGGRIAGEQVAVRPDSLFQDRDYPVLNEYRGWLGGLLARLYDLDAARIARVLPGSVPRDLRLV